MEDKPVPKCDKERPKPTPSSLEVFKNIKVGLTVTKVIDKLCESIKEDATTAEMSRVALIEGRRQPLKFYIEADGDKYLFALCLCECHQDNNSTTHCFGDCCESMNEKYITEEGMLDTERLTPVLAKRFIKAIQKGL